MGKGNGVRLFQASTDTPKGRQKRGTLSGRENSALSLIGYLLLISVGKRVREREKEREGGRERERGREREGEGGRGRGREGGRDKESN